MQCARQKLGHNWLCFSLPDRERQAAPEGHLQMLLLPLLSGTSMVTFVIEATVGNTTMGTEVAACCRCTPAHPDMQS